MPERERFRMDMWLESIRSDGVTMANGEYEVEVRVSRATDRERDLPGLCRRLTIEDTVQVGFELLSDGGEEEH